jgi:hypothetical protein
MKTSMFWRSFSGSVGKELSCGSASRRTAFHLDTFIAGLPRTHRSDARRKKNVKMEHAVVQGCTRRKDERGYRADVAELPESRLPDGSRSSKEDWRECRKLSATENKEARHDRRNENHENHSATSSSHSPQL